MLEIGTKAPAFSLPDQNGDMHTLSLIHILFSDLKEGHDGKRS